MVKVDAKLSTMIWLSGIEPQLHGSLGTSSFFLCYYNEVNGTTLGFSDIT